MVEAGSLVALAYGSGVYYSSVNPEFQKTFVKYVPLGGTIIDFLEEREYQNNLGAQANRQRSSPSATTSSVVSALENRSSSSSLTSKMTEELTAEEKLKQDIPSNSNATSAKSSKDPLSPKRFFNAVSGTVGDEDRDYLPLVLLPDDHDEIVNKAAMSLNDLISSFNASAIAEETVLSVSQTLANVAQNNAAVAPHYAQVIMIKSENFNKLYQNYRLIWEEYLNTQEQIAGHETSLKSNPVFADYNKKMAEEITETELLLVKLINAGRRGRDLDVNDPEYIKFKNSAINKKKYKPSVILSTKSQPELLEGPAALTSYDVNYGAFDGSDISLRLKLALTLLVSALQKQSPVASYIQGVRDAIAKYPDDSKRETAINEALSSIAVPEDVDLQPVLHDILAYDGAKHS